MIYLRDKHSYNAMSITSIIIIVVIVVVILIIILIIILLSLTYNKYLR